MRHRVFGKKLSRTKSQRKALFKSLIVSLILRERIKTTEAKAKAVRGLVEKIITKAKNNGLHAQRQIASVVHDKKALNKLITEIAPRFKNRSGGFTRILKLGKRRGDQAMIVELSLVEGGEAKSSPSSLSKKKQKKQKSKKGLRKR